MVSEQKKSKKQLKILPFLVKKSYFVFFFMLSYKLDTHLNANQKRIKIIKKSILQKKHVQGDYSFMYLKTFTYSAFPSFFIFHSMPNLINISSFYFVLRFFFHPRDKHQNYTDQKGKMWICIKFCSHSKASILESTQLFSLWFYLHIEMIERKRNLYRDTGKSLLYTYQVTFLSIYVM